MTDKKGGPARAVGLMMIITLAGKALGLIRDRLLTVNYGSGMETNAFLTASRIPRVFFDAIFASAITASFIPVFNEYIVKKSKRDAYSLAGSFLAIMLLASAVLTVLGMLFAPELTYFFADGYDAETAALATMLTRIMFPTVIFTAAAYSFVGILQSFNEFNIPALISVVSNALIILYFLTLNDRFGIIGLAVAFLIAWLLQALIQVPWLIKKRVRLRLAGKSVGEGLKKIFRLMLPVLVSTWVLPINQTINSKFGSRLFDGAGVSAVELSHNLYTIIVGVFVLSITNFIFPQMSRAAAGSDSKGLKHTVRSSMHTSFYFVFPMMAGLMALSYPIVDLIYGGGEFGQFSVTITSRALFYVSIGMAGYTVQAVISRAYFAEQKGLVPLISGIISIAVNVGLCALLMKRFDVAGIAVASAVAATVNGLILVIPMKRRGLLFADAAFLKDTAKMLLSAAVMGGCVYMIYTLFSGTNKLVLVIVPVTAGVIIYFILTYALRLPEAKMTAAMLKKRKA